jgi:biopolymer transport protein ExbB
LDRHYRSRWVSFRSASTAVQPLWAAGQFDRLQARLDASDSTLARVVAHLVQGRHQDARTVGEGAADIASLELRTHQKEAYGAALTVRRNSSKFPSGPTT